MRPAGEVRQVLFDAAQALTTPDRSPTLLELAVHTQVGFMAARRTVDNMRRAGVLVVVRTRKVDYRNRPVAEYATPKRLEAMGVQRVPLRDLFVSWATPIV